MAKAENVFARTQVKVDKHADYVLQEVALYKRTLLVEGRSLFQPVDEDSI